MALVSDRFPKLDIDALYDESERRGISGECLTCNNEHVLCWVCGVCFKYCHDDWYHEIDYSEDGIGLP